MMRFWIAGTRWTSISTPRSPRATITASVAATIASRCCTACGFSILTTMSAVHFLDCELAPQACDVLRLSHERQRDEIDVVGVLRRPVEIVQILVGQRFDGEIRARAD